MSISTKSKPLADDEIDLVPLIQALWSNKAIILATTLAGAAISLSLYAVSPKQWTASTYINKSSLYNLYEEVKEKEGTSNVSPQPVEPLLYNAIQNDIFYTAIGVMTSQAITVKETTPKTGRNESVLYIASATAPTAEQASAQLNGALESANSEALALNLPALATESSIRAFNTLDEVKIVNNKNAKKLSAIGGLFGFFLGCAFIVGRFMIRRYKNPDLR